MLPHITLRGSPFEIGKQYGRAARQRIVQHLANQKAIITGLHPEDPQWWVAEARSYLPFYEDLAPHLLEEMEGLARGAELSFNDILLLNLRDEVVSTRAIASEACTSFGCSGALTRSGEPILGQTKDTAAVSADLYVVMAMYQKGRPDLLQMAYAGEVAAFGLSSAGMSCLGNSIYVKGRSRGKLPAEPVRRLVLEAESTEAVLALLDKYGIGTPGSLTIGDSTGRTIALESTDHGHAVVEATDDLLVHTNHIDSPLRLYEAYDEPERMASHRRQERLTALLAAESGRLTAPLAMRCLMDHANYPRSICRHSSGPGDIQTTAALVVEPVAGRLHAIRGQACCGWPATYSL